MASVTRGSMGVVACMSKYTGRVPSEGDEERAPVAPATAALGEEDGDELEVQYRRSARERTEPRAKRGIVESDITSKAVDTPGLLTGVVGMKRGFFLW